MIDLSQPKIVKELEWLASLPVSKQAERLLTMVKAGRGHPAMPSVLALLQWGVEDAAPEFNLDSSRAEAEFQLAMMRLVEKGPKAATLRVLNLDDPETEVLPAIRDAKTPEQAAKAALSLAE